MCLLQLISAVVLVALAVPSPAVAQRQARPDNAELEAIVQETMREWNVPGAAVAIVRGEQPLLVRGFGYRDLANKKPVTERTLFRIGSITKSFTAAGVAALVSQGKLEWDEPVREALPELRLYSDELTAGVTPVDLLSHRTGLPRHDAIWYYNRDWSRENLMGRLRYMEPSKDLREAFQYNNFMFLAAGYLTGQVLDTSWEEAIRDLIFEPLSMTATNVSLDAMEQNRDHALSYLKDKQDMVQKAPSYAFDGLAPAGLINSNAEEMGRYLSMLMNDGRYKDQQVLAKADVQKMTTAQMVVGPSDPRYPELGDSAYGLGLLVTNYRGRRLVHHGGGLDGFRAHLAFLPQEKLGIVVLSNLGRNNFVIAVSQALFDHFLGVPDGNWAERYLSDEKTAKAAQDEAESKGYSPRKSGTQPSHALADYAGHYEHPGYGTVRIEQAGDQLTVRYGSLDTALEHFHYDSFEFITEPVSQSKLRLRFETDAEGEIASLSAPLEPLVAPIVFIRIADPRMREPAFLRPLTGKYALGNTIFEVVLREDGQMLVVQPNGQTLYLEPMRGTTFRIKDRAGWSLEFKRATDAGAINEAVLHVPGASSVLKRKER